jgi:hypothetical protein
MSPFRTRAERKLAGDSSPDPLRSASELARAPSIERALQAVREFLGMDIAYATEHIGDIQHIRRIEGDESTPSGADPDYSLPMPNTRLRPRSRL